MKHFVLFFIVFVGLYYAAAATPKKRYRGPARTEAELMNDVIGCLRNKDSIGYYHLFPPFDTLWNMLLRTPITNPEMARELNNLKAHPTILIDFDPFYNHSILGRFNYILRKGEDSGLQWSGIIMQRYELQQQGVAQGMQGIQHLAPERFKGFLFVRDIMSSTTYCITIMEIQKINGYFFGGQVINTLEANTIDDYLRKEAAEAKFLDQMRKREEGGVSDSVLHDSTSKVVSARDSVVTDSTLSAADSAKLRKKLLYTVPPAEDDAAKMKREIVDRRLYDGKFDDEIPVELYIRYMRDANGKVTNWDALYKFGDLQEYVKMEVSKTKEGLWVFEEPVATLELELNGKVYTGEWINGVTQTGYDAELVQKELSQEKIVELDYILENGTWGKTSEQKITEKEEEGESRSQKRKRRKKQRDPEPEAATKPAAPAKKEDDGE